jgi:16S rRNA (cytosine967-C5)-methyltransferase
MLPVIAPAASVVAAAHQGARASAALSEVIAARRLGPVEAEQLARLAYGALRRQRRVREVLREVSESAGLVENARVGVVAAALLEGLLDLELAARAEPAIAWARFVEADAGVLQRATGATRVALLGSLPDWLASELLAQYGGEAEALAASLSEPAPRTLRVNSLVTDVADARSRLEQEGATVSPGRLAKRALRLEGAFNPFATRAFHEGVFELQDEGSQVVCELVAPPPRGLVVDACAGAGGKSLSVAAGLEGRGKVVALDVDGRKLASLRERAKRAGAANVQPLTIEETGALPEAVQALAGKVDRLLIDAPCSGTGVLRRNPEARARLTTDAVARLALLQREIVERMLPLLAPGGRLIFATCSLLRAEGEDLMDAVEAAHPELVPVNLAEIYDRAYVDRFVRVAPHRLRLLPHLHDTDGFFVSCLRRARERTVSA